MSENVVPDSDAKSKGETVKITALKPFDYPEHVGDALFLKVLKECGKSLFEEEFPDLKHLNQLGQFVRE